MPSRTSRVLESRDHLGGYLEDQFDEYLTLRGPVGFAATPKWRPPTDVFETAEAVIIVMDLPGMSPEEIGIEMDGELLTVSGVRTECARGKRHYHVMEIQMGPFERRIRVRHRIDVARIDATYDRGFLEIRLPKSEEAPAGRRQVPIR